MTEKPHPGITMHKLPVGGGFVGLLFAFGSALIFLIGFPTLWYFVALAFGLGIGIAIVLRIVHSGHADRNKPLSILTMTENPAKAVSRPRRKFRVHNLPKLASA